MDQKNNEFNSRFSGVKVHPNAFVDPSAELHDGVIVSQGAIVGPDVTIGKGTEMARTLLFQEELKLVLTIKFSQVFL